MFNGIKNITNKEYHESDGISKSQLFLISKSPQHFKYEMDNPSPKTQALIFGSAIHKYILEPDGFYNEFSVMPNIDRRTKLGKEEYQDFLKCSAGKNVITEEEFDQILAMKESILQNKYFKMILETGIVEQSYYWNDELTGELCKCRPDVLVSTEDINIIADLKSCISADTQDFVRDAVRYGYDLQSAMYLDGVKEVTGKDFSFLFFAIEKSPPYALNVLQADPLMIKRGRDLFRELIGIYHQCKKSNNWYGYNGFSGYINNLGLPAWMAKDYE